MVAEAADGLVSAGWVRFVAGPQRLRDAVGRRDAAGWRGRGIYRALVARPRQRARARARRGHLQVDASDESRPILRRLGFIAVTTTTPFTWTPASRR